MLSAGPLVCVWGGRQGEGSDRRGEEPTVLSVGALGMGWGRDEVGQQPRRQRRRRFMGWAEARKRGVDPGDKEVWTLEMGRHTAPGWALPGQQAGAWGEQGTEAWR